MIAFAQPLFLLLAVPMGLFTIRQWQSGGVLTGARRSLALAARCTLIACVLLALAGPSLQLPAQRQAVMVVADLSASDSGARASMAAGVSQAERSMPHGDMLGVVAVGRDAVLDQPPRPNRRFSGFAVRVDPSATNLEGGLNLAGALFPAHYRRHVLLVSDGNQTLGDGVAAVRLLRDQNTRVDVLAVSQPRRPEVLLSRLQAPTFASVRQRFSIGMTVRSSIRTTARLVLERDGVEVASRPEVIAHGTHTYSFDQVITSPRFYRYIARVSPRRDTNRRNNQMSAGVDVRGPPRVLVVASRRSDAVNIVAALRASGITTDLRAPSATPSTPEALQPYGTVVLANTSASALGAARMRALAAYVQGLGRGLLVTGGPAAYAPGGYANTPLARVLPVTMTPRRKDLPSVAVVLIIESLESLQPIQISKAAAKRLVGLLSPRDEVAINDAPLIGVGGWVVPLQPVRNRTAIDAAISRMNPGDPPTYLSFLQSAFRVLRRSHARVKHIILVGDGDAIDNYASTLRKIHAAGITVSAVATNDALLLGDPALMRRIARWGGGHYYRASDPKTVPSIFLQEARSLNRTGIARGRFHPVRLLPGAALSHLTALPDLTGYDLTGAKRTAQILLESKKQDPILAEWQVGLGRVAAWTSDASGRWTADWLRSPAASRIWVNLVSWTLPPLTSGSLSPAVRLQQGQGTIAVSPPGSLGSNPRILATIVDPRFRSETVQLVPTGTGKYVGEFTAPRQGIYLVTARAAGQRRSATGQTSVTEEYPDEYRAIGTNLPFLRALAAAGGGRQLQRPPQVWSQEPPEVYRTTSLAASLWLLALLLLPIDVAIRRIPTGRSSRLASAAPGSHSAG